MTSLTSTTVRRLGLIAMIGSVVGLLYFPFHASSYFATADGEEMLESPWVAAWNGAFRDMVGPALTFSDPDTVYLSWGKFMAVVAGAHLCGIIALHARQQQAGGRLMRAGYRLLLVSAGMLATAAFILNWVPGGLMDAVFLGLAVPSVLLTLVAYPLYGVATLRARVAPRGVAWLMTFAAFPGIIVMAALVGHLGGGLALVHLTWVLMGRAIWRGSGQIATAREESGTAV